MITKDTLEVASIALNAKVAKMESYPEGTSGHAMKEMYRRALNEVNAAIADAFNDTPPATQ